MGVLKFIGISICIQVILASPVVQRQKRSGNINSAYDDYWSAWGPCSPACGGGTQHRTLGCTNANNKYNKACLTTSASCNLVPCYDEYGWQEWGDCSTECQGNAKQPIGTRKRYSSIQADVHQVINCNVQSCDKVDGCGKADLLFVLDSSGSVGEVNWYRTKQFALDVISGLTLGPDETHVGVVTFSTEVSTPVKLGKYGTIEEIRNTIWNMPYMAGSTNTADALRMIRTMNNQYGRRDIKTVVVVVTDGESNILPETTIPEADLCRQEAMTLFAIGIGSAKNEELKGIANDPDSEYYYYVEEYEGLHSIVTSIVSETCDTANQVVCEDWSSWSECSVICGGSGTQFRSRDCQMVDYYGDVTKEFTRTESQTCVTESCTTPTTTTVRTSTRTTAVTSKPATPPPATTPPRPGPDCSLCDFHDNTGYMQDGTDCGAYIECVKKLDDLGSYRVYYRKCSVGLYWSQTFLTCTRTAPSTGCAMVTPGPTVTGPSINTTGPVPGCPLRQDALDPSRFYFEVNGKNIYQKCPPNMEFDEEFCGCAGTPVGIACNNDLLLHFPFDTHFNDVTCNRASSDIHGNPTLVNDPSRPGGKVAYFDGSSRLTVSFLHNWFVGNMVYQWTVSVWFMIEHSTPGISGLVNNGDCKQGPSFEVFLAGSGVASGKVQTDDSVMTKGEEINVRTGAWEHLVMVYSGNDVMLYLNGVRQGQGIEQHGYISNRQCPMNIAHEGRESGTGYFRGYMDELRIYRRSLSDSEVGELYSNF